MRVTAKPRAFARSASSQVAHVGKAIHETCLTIDQEPCTATKARTEQLFGPFVVGLMTVQNDVTTRTENLRTALEPDSLEREEGHPHH
jgi:hypothetical protein